ncbi:MAG: SoxR reducing system RseC family protein [Deltaproteobacteria bacterium]|nr:SoxR reducing system RseC family protein [Deltaproteobacteria bacterium]
MNKEHVEEGVVVEQLPDNHAKVKIRKSSSCDACSHKGFCNPFGRDSMIIVAANPLNAGAGQKVRMAFKVEKERKAVTILYIVPLIGLLVGAFVGDALNLCGNRDASAAFFSILFVVITFLGIRYYSRIRYERDVSYKPTVIEIVE